MGGFFCQAIGDHLRHWHVLRMYLTSSHYVPDLVVLDADVLGPWGIMDSVPEQGSLDHLPYINGPIHSWAGDFQLLDCNGR